MRVPTLPRAGTGPDTFLATEQRSYDQDLSHRYGPKQSHSRCLNSKGRVVNTHTGQSLVSLCERRTCLACNRLYLARDFRDAVRLSKPNQMLLLTGLPMSWPLIKMLMRNLLRRMKRAGYDVNLVYAVEPDPAGTGAHAHGWLYGCTATREVWSEHAKAVGFGSFVGLQRVTHDRDFAYPIKLATWNQESLTDYLAVNGTQRVHPTRGFWRDARTGDVHGSMPQAAAAWRGLPKRERGAWTFELGPRQRLSALSPAQAARIRKRNSAQAGFSLVAYDTGEVLFRTGRRIEVPSGSGRVGAIALTVRMAAELLAFTDRGLKPVERLAA